MRFLKNSVLLLLALVFGTAVHAQMTADPSSWKYEVKKKSATEYQLVFHLDLKQGWHIWSLNPGGDGFQIVPSFNIEGNNAQVIGKPTEKGKATTTLMGGVDGKVTYLSGKVDYTLNLTVKNTPVKVKGTHTYQVCDDKMCLAPVDKAFEVEID
jgi:thiol:disulfide interchange protein DsbD